VRWSVPCQFVFAFIARKPPRQTYGPISSLWVSQLTSITGQSKLASKLAMKRHTGALNISLSEYAAVPATSFPPLARRSRMSDRLVECLTCFGGMGSASGSLAGVPIASDKSLLLVWNRRLLTVTQYPTSDWGLCKPRPRCRQDVCDRLMMVGLFVVGEECIRLFLEVEERRNPWVG
jgi:hypothetical protein